MKKEVRKICTMCGNKFKLWDEYADLSISLQIGYGSIYDGDQLKMDLCCNCFDKLIDTLKFICKQDPVQPKT